MPEPGWRGAHSGPAQCSGSAPWHHWTYARTEQCRSGSFPYPSPWQGGPCLHPAVGRGCLYAASQIVVAIQGLVARRSSPVEPVLLGVGKFAAGTTYNAVAEYAELEGTTRTISQETRLQVREWIDQTAEQIAAISGAEAG